LRSLSGGGRFIANVRSWLSAWGYRYVEVPTLVTTNMFRSCTEGTDNRMFQVAPGLSLMPEVTNYIRTVGAQRLGAAKVFYVARCFRDETTTDSERLREFTQIGVEYLGPNALDCRKVVRKDALKLFKELLPDDDWSLEDGAERGLNLYDDSGKTFEISSTRTRKQILGGGPYKGGAGWALGLERLMIAREG
jgi:histidyl-tRNA synthetase